MTSCLAAVTSYEWMRVIPHKRAIVELLEHPEHCLLFAQRLHVEACLAAVIRAQEKLATAIDESSLKAPAKLAFTKRAEYLHHIHDELLTLLCPIRRLPVELLARIFCSLKEVSFYIPTPIVLPTYRPHAHYRPPLRDVMLVCKQWYNIGDASCPSLWVDLRIDFNHHRASVLPHVLASTLRRSRGHPISFEFAHHDSGTTRSDTLVRSVYKILAEHSSRWRKVHIDIHSERELDWCRSVQPKLGCLEKLTLSLTSRNSSFDVAGLFCDAPNLRELQLHGFPANYATALPMHRLTSFEFASVYSGKAPDASVRAWYLKALQDSPTLSRFDYPTIPTPYTAPSSSGGRILKPLVRELSIGDPAFLASLLLPSLTSLVMGCFVEGVIPAIPQPPETLYIIYKMLEESRFPSLITLTLSNVLLDDTLLDILDSLDTLQSFYLTLTEWDEQHDSVLEEFVEDMWNEDDDGLFPFLPSLRSFDLELEDRYHNSLYSEYLFFDDSFAEMVLARIERSALRGVEVSVASEGGSWPMGKSKVRALRDAPGVLINAWDWEQESGEGMFMSDSSEDDED
ncbi:hypothetical protein BDZ89DRAFT_1082321 [Hymenopellis radicata]|nr:hypothetical protein BDZ89DRAFT_1082321 [Hymenopellis radicata]